MVDEASDQLELLATWRKIQLLVFLFIELYTKLLSIKIFKVFKDGVLKDLSTMSLCPVTNYMSSPTS